MNPFDAGTALLKKLRDQAKHFHSSNSNRVKYEEMLNDHPDLPRISLKRDLSNTTRISSVFYLVRASLKLKQSLDMYYVITRIPPFLTGDLIPKLRRENEFCCKSSCN